MEKGKTAIVTGASRGIGRAISLELASRGYNIAAIYAKERGEARAVCNQCEEKYGVKAEAYACDVSSAAQVKATVSLIDHTFGQIDLLVNNAGITRDGLAIVMKDEDFDQVIGVNLRGAFLMSKACLPTFVRRRSGCIINISSISGLTGNAGQVNYAASKAGLIGLTRTLAREYAGRGIRCNAVAPGYIETEMTEGLRKLHGITPGRQSDLEDRIPLRRLGSAEEVAAAAAFLAEAEYITGEVLRVDGGAAI